MLNLHTHLLKELNAISMLYLKDFIYCNWFLGVREERFEGLVYHQRASIR
jgi:hypothetical protein